MIVVVSVITPSQWEQAMAEQLLLQFLLVTKCGAVH
jgi:hypothetical protein